MDKIQTKELFRKNNIPTPDWWEADSPESAMDLAAEEIDFPVVVKPPDEGSSLDVSIVSDADQLETAAYEVLENSDTLLVEEYIDGRELTVGILGDTVLPILELKTDREFYDYMAKYSDSKTRYLCPAPITERARRKITKYAIEAFDLCSCRDVVRFDVMMDRKRNCYFLEGNSIPGFTDHSLVPLEAKTAGIDFGSMCEILVRNALRRSKKTVSL